MTDFAPTDPAAAPAAKPDLDGYVRAEVHEREIAERARERNLYKPYQQTIGRLPEGQRGALLTLAQMVAEGDTEGIIDWSVGSIEAVSGKSAAEIIAARQAQTPIGAPVPQGASEPAAAPAPAAIDVDALRREITEQVRVETNNAVQKREQMNAIQAKMTAAGIEPFGPSGYAVIHIAKGITGADPVTAIDQAIAAFKADLLGQSQRAAEAAAAVAGAVPAPVPGGVPVGSSPAADLSPGERALARLTARPG